MLGAVFVLERQARVVNIGHHRVNRRQHRGRGIKQDHPGIA
jgi:hypothetical protein